MPAPRTLSKKIKCMLFENTVQSENSDKARELKDKSFFGEYVSNNLIFSSYEAMFLLENQKIELFDQRSKQLTKEQFTKIASKKDKNFMTKSLVFSDLRLRGYTVKTGLKFGADFRVYEKSKKPGDEHSKWIVFCVTEKDLNKWQDFTAKSRVANSTKKKLLIAIIDDERDVTYYEVAWVMP